MAEMDTYILAFIFISQDTTCLVSFTGNHTIWRKKQLFLWNRIYSFEYFIMRTLHCPISVNVDSKSFRVTLSLY